MIKKILAVNYTLTGPGIQPGSDPTSAFEGIISLVFSFLTLIAVIFFAIQVIFAGYSFISSKGDEKKMESARSHLIQGILGLTVVILAVGLASLIANLLGIENIFSLTSFFEKIGR